jgi:hypothetical protein
VNLQITPIYLLLALILGLLLGILLASLFSSRGSKPEDQNKPPSDVEKDGFNEAASLWYTPAGKKVLTKMDGEYYRDFLLLTVEQKKRVLRLQQVWSDWIAGTPKPDVVDTFREVRNSEDSSDTLQPPVFVQQTSTEIPKIKPDAVMLEAPAPVKPKTIAGQISEIIDEMLVDSPIKEKGIKLIENEKHGVDVWIGLEKYDGIESIPYPEIKQLIKSAVARWEQEAEDLRRATSI